MKLTHSSKIILVLLVSVNIVAASVNTDQVIQRPNYIFIREELSSFGSINLGFSEDSDLQLYLSSFQTDQRRSKLSGNPNFIVDNSKINISGNVSFSIKSAKRSVSTLYQTASYFQDFDVNTRIISNIVDTDDRIIDNFALSSVIDTPPSYAVLNNNANFTKFQNQLPALSGFMARTGSIISIPLNNTNGEDIGKIFAFRLEILVFIYKTSDQRIVGFYRTSDTGFGNIFPEEVIDYLKNQEFTRTILGPTRGANLLDSYNVSQIDWINRGFNSTLGLDIKLALYNFNRVSTRVFFSNQLNSGLHLDQVSEDLETYMEEVISLNSISSFNEDQLNLFESGISNEVLKDVEPITSLPSSSVPNQSTSAANRGIGTIDSEIFMVSQITAIFIITIVILVKRKNS